MNMQVIDKALLEDIKNFFNVGDINSKHGPKTIQFRVSSPKDLIAIIDYFYKFPLKTQKRADF